MPTGEWKTRASGWPRSASRPCASATASSSLTRMRSRAPWRRLTDAPQRPCPTSVRRSSVCPMRTPRGFARRWASSTRSQRPENPSPRPPSSRTCVLRSPRTHRALGAVVLSRTPKPCVPPMTPPRTVRSRGYSKRSRKTPVPSTRGCDRRWSGASRHRGPDQPNAPRRWRCSSNSARGMVMSFVSSSGDCATTRSLENCSSPSAPSSFASPASTASWESRRAPA